MQKSPAKDYSAACEGFLQARPGSPTGSVASEDWERLLQYSDSDDDQVDTDDGCVHVTVLVPPRLLCQQKSKMGCTL